MCAFISMVILLSMSYIFGFDFALIEGFADLSTPARAWAG
jgi:hypothetical protein